MGNPQAVLFAKHRRRYQVGETGAGLVRGRAPGSKGAIYLAESIEASLWAARPDAGLDPGAAQEPGLLRLALSAAKSMAQFVGSGFKTTSPQTLHQRLEACTACEPHTGLRCRPCGYFADARARLAHKECPIRKW
jgi:hypothetical protein